MESIFCHGKIIRTTESSEPYTRTITVKEIQSSFPEFCIAIIECHSLLNPIVDLNQLFLCTTYSYAENTLKRKRFQVYTHVAYVCGFSERTKLPEALEAAVKSTWHDEGEKFVGFLPN